MAYGAILSQTPTASNVAYNNSQTSSIITGSNVQQAIDQLFTSVSNGKQQIASAITDKGVSTSANDSFATMATNIRAIPTVRTYGEREIGEIVSLTHNGIKSNFIVINQGVPSSLYDDSCDGTWLLSENLYTLTQWSASTNVNYAQSDIHNLVNNEYYSLFDRKSKEKIKQVKIPYVNSIYYNGEVLSGSNGLSCNCFILSAREVGKGTDNRYNPNDGVLLPYFIYGETTEANNKRIVVYNGNATRWWLRSPSASSTNSWYCSYTGVIASKPRTEMYGARIAMVVYSNMVID